MKWFAWLFVFVLLLAGFAWLALYFDSLRHGPKAAYLLADLQQLSFQHTDLAAARHLSAQHDGAAFGDNNCTLASCDFVIHVTPAITRLIRATGNARHDFTPLFAALGLRPWSLTASLNVRNDRLTHMSIAAVQARFDKPLEYFADINHNPDADPKPAAQPGNKPAPKPGAKPSGKPAVKPAAPPAFTIVHPQATEPPADVTQVWSVSDPDRTWRRAFDLDLTCFLTVFEGCRDTQQLAPDVRTQ